MGVLIRAECFAAANPGAVGRGRALTRLHAELGTRVSPSKLEEQECKHLADTTAGVGGTALEHLSSEIAEYLRDSKAGGFLDEMTLTAVQCRLKVRSPSAPSAFYPLLPNIKTKTQPFLYTSNIL